MIDKDFLQRINVIYVEDDEDISKYFLDTLTPFFKNIYAASDGKEAIDIFNDLRDKKIKIDAIISDVDMPNLNGIELLEYIRTIRPSLPFFFTTAHSDSEFLLSAIKLGATDYALKPIDIKDLLKKIEKFCRIEENDKLIKAQKKELERYLKAIDNVAIISKTDTKGRITFANQIFCDIAKYTREEIYGKPHNIVRHPDMPSAAFEDLWKTVKSGRTWQGKVKNRAKDGSAYYVNATIIPLYDNTGEIINEYIGIRFLTTDDELEKREFKRKVLQNIKDSKQKDYEQKKKIDELTERLDSLKDLENLNEILEKEKKRSDKLYNQIEHYEDELKDIKLRKEKLVTMANQKVKNTSTLALKLKSSNDKLLMKNTFLNDEIEKKKKQITILQDRNEEQSRIIKDLRDVINFREKELENIRKN